MPGIILHHYDTSPFSEKVRLLLGLKGLAWGSVQQPVIMPKPELIPLTGGYRRIPVMQVGADIYCDSQVIMAEIERLAPDPPAITGPAWAVNFWADRAFFNATVPLIFGELGDKTPKDFIADREKLSGRPFDVAGMKAAAGVMRPQWRAHAAWIEQALGTSRWLSGANPGLSDIAAYMNIWFLSRSLPGICDELLTGLDRVLEWRGEVAALGHGSRSEMDGLMALEAAKRAQPAEPPSHDPDDALGLAPGTPIAVSADDYGRDPIAGKLVAATPDRIILARDAGELGTLNVHFPRAGYFAGPVQA